MVPAESRPLPPYISTLIQVTARRIVGRCGLNESDQDDIEQRITLDVLRRRGGFDPSKALENTFLARLVRHALADLIADRTAPIRDRRREEGSLDEWVKDGEEWALRGDAVAADGDRRRGGASVRGADDVRDLAIDMARAAAALPARLRRVYELLKELGSAREVARASGWHPSSVYEAIEQIRSHFEEAGLAEYLHSGAAYPTDSSLRR